MSETEKGPVPEGDTKPEANVFEKVVSERKAKLDRMNRRFQEQAAKRACVAAKAGDGFGSLASVVREAAANGLDGDEIAGALGVRRLYACFWYFGFIPGIVVNSLCALLNHKLVEQAFVGSSLDGEPASYFMASLVVPILLSVGVLVVLLGKAVRAAGSRGYWRTFLGYAVGALLVGLTLLFVSLRASDSLRLILFRA